MKTFTHDNHEHNVKVINEEILGIKIDDRECDKISEAFGWKDENFDKVMDTMNSFYKFQDAAEELNGELMPQSTKISTLADFLKSSPFKALGIKIVTPNDYFMLGFIWNCVLIKRRGLDNGLAVSGGNLLELLKMLAKKGE